MATAPAKAIKLNRGIANLLTFRKDPLAFLTKMAREHGDAVSYKMGPRTVTLLNHPDYIKDLLVTQQPQVRKGTSLAAQ
jgi:hypothetical protein